MHSTAVADADAVGCPKALVAGAPKAGAAPPAGAPNEKVAGAGAAAPPVAGAPKLNAISYVNSEPRARVHGDQPRFS